METSMKGNTRKGNLMVRGYSHLLMGTGMLGNSRMATFGTERHMKQMGTSLESG